ncbi:MAG: K(+)-transporting ATPase subunit C [Mobilitalea sp.]
MKILKPALVLFGIMTLLCGVFYTAAVTGVAQLIFPYQANGSIITAKTEEGTEAAYGSALLGQVFTKSEYLIGRPIGTTNLSPVSTEQRELIQERVDWWHAFDYTNSAELPLDLVTASGSGVDPNISPEAAEYQVKRIAKERNISETMVREIIEEYSTGRFLGFWGEPVVNVLKVNLALDGLVRW